jgi:2-polyprenyl-6-methoxyphenol hydroxylase-like FAD-dependent oxidoreductase
MPDGIAALQRLGVSIPPMEAHRFNGIRFVSSGLSIAATFPSGFGLGVRRPNLHRIMIEHAERVGVRFLWRAVVTGLDPGGVLVENKPVRARWIVGADGGGSRVRRWAGLDVHKNKDQRFAFRRHYRIAPWGEFMELHWGPSCQLYVTPVGPEEVCVALISRDHGLRLDDAMSAFPAVAARLRGAAHGSAERGAESVTRKLSRVCSERVALIGDASGGVDAITGEGLCLAFNQAGVLGDCLAAGSLDGYQAGHRTVARRPAVMSRLMLLLENREGLRGRAMRAFARKPELFSRLLASHVGAVSPTEFAMDGVALGWGLLRA